MAYSVIYWPCRLLLSFKAAYFVSPTPVGVFYYGAGTTTAAPDSVHVSPVAADTHEDPDV